MGYFFDYLILGLFPKITIGHIRPSTRFATVLITSSLLHVGSCAVLVQPRFQTSLTQNTSYLGVTDQTNLEFVCRTPILSCYDYGNVFFNTGCIAYGSGINTVAASPTYYDKCTSTLDDRIFYACIDTGTMDAVFAPFHKWISDTCSRDAMYESWNGIVPVLEIVSYHAWKSMCVSHMVPKDIVSTCEQVLCYQSDRILTVSGIPCADQCASLATSPSIVLVHEMVTAFRDLHTVVCGINMPNECTTFNSYCTATVGTGVISERCSHGVTLVSDCSVPYGCLPQRDGGICYRGECFENYSRPVYFRQCACDPGFHGEFCGENPDDCVDNLCVNGTCVDGDDSYTCVCDASSRGTWCEQPINPNDCVEHTCVHGKCIDGDDMYTCLCDTGYTGDRCLIDIDYCIGVSCGFGECQDRIDMYVCICKSGWSHHVDTDSCDLRVDCTSTHEFRHPQYQYCLPCDESCMECVQEGVDGCVTCTDSGKSVNGTMGACRTEAIDCGYQCPLDVSPDWWKGIVVLCAIYLGIVVVYGVGQHIHPDADNSVIVTYGVALVNVVTDIIFAVTVYMDADGGATNGFFVVTICIMGISSCINVGMCIYFFVRHLNDIHVGQWVEKYHSVTAALVLLSLVSVQALRFAGSHLFKIDVLHLQWPDHVIMRVKIFALITIATQELPQMVVQVAFISSRGYVGLVAMVSVIASGIALGYGATSRVFLCLAIVRRGRRVDELLLTSGIGRSPSNWMQTSTGKLKGERLSPLTDTLGFASKSTDCLASAADQDIYDERPTDIELVNVTGTRTRARSAGRILIDSIRKPMKRPRATVTSDGIVYQPSTPDAK